VAARNPVFKRIRARRQSAGFLMPAPHTTSYGRQCCGGRFRPRASAGLHRLVPSAIRLKTNTPKPGATISVADTQEALRQALQQTCILARLLRSVNSSADLRRLSDLFGRVSEFVKIPLRKGRRFPVLKRVEAYPQRAGPRTEEVSGRGETRVGLSGGTATDERGGEIARRANGRRHPSNRRRSEREDEESKGRSIRT